MAFLVSRSVDPAERSERRDARGRGYVNAVTGAPTREHPAEQQFRTMVGWGGVGAPFFELV